MEAPQLNKNRGSLMKMKRYEEMLVKEILGTSRPNEPLQAVIENQLNEAELEETNNSILERNRALLQYIATIANSNSKNDEFNYEFVESLIRGGANINTADQHGQTIFHEVARSWNTDIATFLLSNGCNINKQDNFGRSPLHVASAVDFVEMTQFLLENNADIDARTYGESQAPIHYAAKSGATRSLKMLLGFNANIDSPDAKQRTPLQLAAEWTRDKTAKVLIDEGAASCLMDCHGCSALCFLIDRLPNLALQALDQLHTSDVITTKDIYYLHHLEASKQKLETKRTRTPLEAAVTTQKYEVVTHPAMQRLIQHKWIQYGRLSTILDLLFHVVFGIMWTAFCMGTTAEGKDLYENMQTEFWRSVIGILIILMTIYDIGRHIHSTIKSRRSQENWINWRTEELQDDLKYCHPRWPQERKYVEYEVKRLRSLPLFDAYDMWFYLEWLILFVILVTITTHFIHYQVGTWTTRYTYTHAISIVNLLVWLRLLRYVRPFPGIGTLVIVLGETSGDFINWAFLLFLLLVPFTAAFWINFGAISSHPVHGYHEAAELIYTVFQMAIGDNFNLEGIVEADPVMARILVALYVTAMAIVALNLLIALLSDTFSRVYNNALANTIMQRAVKIVEAERVLWKSKRTKYTEYMRLNCSPEVIDMKFGDGRSGTAGKSAGVEMLHDLADLKGVLDDRFGRIYGKDRTSDFDAIVDNVKKLQTQNDEVTNDVREISQMMNLLSGKPKPENNSKETGQRRKKRGSRSSRSSQQLEPKGFVSTLQNTATSLGNWFTGNKENDQRARSASRNKRRHHSETRTDQKGRRRERRRGRKREEESDEEKIISTVVHTRRRSRRSENLGFSNTAFQNNQEFAWDNVSIDSVDV